MPEIQHITVQLDGITAGDYLAHQLDSDPPLETSQLRSVTLDVPDPLGDSIGAVLRWDGRPPSARAAATAAGFALTGDVVDVRSRVELRCGHARRRTPQLVVAAA
jgi:hypothetical protein